MFKRKTILVTGGTGTIGSYVVKMLLSTGARKIIVLSRNEYNQYLMKLKYPTVKYVIGDICNYDLLEESFRKVDYVIHTAALKHVGVSEDNPLECVRININGSANVAKAAIKNNVEKVLFISTDKVNKPNCVYGNSKAISEKICLNSDNKSSTLFSVIRFGNIFGSKGSVVEKFYESSKTNNIFPIKNPEATRCFISIKKVWEYIQMAIKIMKGGEIMVPKMKSICIQDIPKLLRSDAKINYVPLHNFEKIHEDIIIDRDMDNLYEEGNLYILINNKTISELHTKVVLKNEITSATCDFYTTEECMELYDEFKDILH